MVDAARVEGSTPSYLHSLWLIGQYLNQQRARRVTIAEVDTGFLLYFFPGGQWKKPVSVAIHYTDLLELSGIFSGSARGNSIQLRGGDWRDKKHPMFPMGYDTVLRALGDKLDRRGGVGLVICETADKMYVNYWIDKGTFVIRDHRRQAVSNTQIEIYDAGGVTKLLTNAKDALIQLARRYEQGLNINPHDYITALSAANLFENDGNYREAEALFNRIVAQVPEHPEAHYHIARLAMVRGDRRGAMNAIRKALAVSAEQAPVQDLYGRILQAQNKLKDATAAFKRAVEIDPDNHIHHFHLAKVYEAQGMKEEAYKEMAQTTHLHAAPGWDMVAENILAEPAPVQSPVQWKSASVEASPSAAALLPQAAPENESAESEDFQADWAASIARADSLHPQSERATSPFMTTTFDTVPVAWAEMAVGAPAAGSAQEAHAGAAPTGQMTLEQRLQAAGTRAQAQATPVQIPPTLPQVAEALPTLARTSWPMPTVAPPPEPASAPPAVASAAPDLATQAPAREPVPEVPAVAPQAEPPTSVAQPGASIEAAAPQSVELAAEVMVIQRALEAEPDRADLHRKLGFLLARQGKTAEAAAAFRKALQCSRTSL